MVFGKEFQVTSIIELTPETIIPCPLPDPEKLLPFHDRSPKKSTRLSISPAGILGPNDWNPLFHFIPRHDGTQNGTGNHGLPLPYSRDIISNDRTQSSSYNRSPLMGGPDVWVG